MNYKTILRNIKKIGNRRYSKYFEFKSVEYFKNNNSAAFIYDFFLTDRLQYNINLKMWNVTF